MRQGRLFALKTNNITSSFNAEVCVRLGVEQLEDRLVPAITFATYDHGTFAYDTNINSWRKISGERALAMSEGRDGTLFATFNNGVQRYNYSNNTWRSLTTAKSYVLSAASDNTLFAVFNNGTFEYTGPGWVQMATLRPSKLAAIKNHQCYAAYSFGTFLVSNVSPGGNIYPAGYQPGYYGYQLTTSVAVAMDSTSKGTLFCSFTTGDRAGTYKYQANQWTRLTSAVAKEIAAVDYEGLYTADYTQFFAIYDTGTWSYNGQWTRIATVAATQIAADGDSFVGTFYGNSVSEWDRWARAWNLIDDSAAALLG